jgi:hypothetical protein
MLYREITAVYCELYMEHTSTLVEQNAKLFDVKRGDIYINN